MSQGQQYLKSANGVARASIPRGFMPDFLISTNLTCCPVLVVTRYLLVTFTFNFLKLKSLVFKEQRYVYVCMLLSIEGMFENVITFSVKTNI